jgi:site-specific recombinase XerD
MDTPNYNIYLYLRKTRPNKENKYPIYIRIRVDKNKMEYPSGQYVKSDHWDDKMQKAIKCKEASTVNGMLDTAKANINQAVSQLYMSKAEVSLDNIRLLLKGEAVEERHTFIQVAKEHNLNFEKQVGKKYSQGSYKNYKTTLKYLIEFVPLYSGKKDIDLKSVNYRFCEAYFSYLTTEKKCHVNGANKQIQRLKKIINYAIRSEYLQNNPMANYSIEFTPVNKVALTMGEINKLAGLELQRQVLKDVRDVFLLQCYTGLSYSDIKQLSKIHISAGENGALWIRMKRQKTNVSFGVPLLPAALLILDKFMTDAGQDTPLMPVISNQKMNENLKVLQELAGISKNLTTHLARHSFASTITLNNGVPITTVSRMLGHTKISTTQIYSKLVDKTIGDDMLILEQKMKSN